MIHWPSEVIPEDSFCTVCFESINSESIIIRISCGHIFHYNCFTQLNRAICPNCRHPIDVEVQIQSPTFGTYDQQQHNQMEELSHLFYPLHFQLRTPTHSPARDDHVEDEIE